MNLLFIGDVVGRSGRQVIETRLPGLLETYNIDFVVVNGENAAGGFGITEKIFHALIDAGADVITTGNHVWDQREALVFADRQERFEIISYLGTKMRKMYCTPFERLSAQLKLARTVSPK